MSGQRTKLAGDVAERAEHELSAARVPAPENPGQLHVAAAGDLEDVRTAVTAAHPRRYEGLAKLHNVGAGDAGVHAGTGDGPSGPTGGAATLFTVVPTARHPPVVPQSSEVILNEPVIVMLPLLAPLVWAIAPRA